MKLPELSTNFLTTKHVGHLESAMKCLNRLVLLFFKQSLPSLIDAFKLPAYLSNGKKVVSFQYPKNLSLMETSLIQDQLALLNTLRNYIPNFLLIALIQYLHNILFYLLITILLYLAIAPLFHYIYLTTLLKMLVATINNYGFCLRT